MPPSASPYKSRLLSFLNRQSLQWRDRAGSTLRHLKVATEWGIQILIYPVYLAVQTARMAGKKLGQTLEKKPLPEISASQELLAIASDRAIEQVLQLVNPSPATESVQISQAIADQPQKIGLESIFARLKPLVPRFIRERGMPLATIEKSSQELAPVNLDSPATISLQATNSVVGGIASFLETRRLVLVTPANELLDILSPTQEKKLQQRIRLELANYWYERRLQLASSTTPGLIPSFSVHPINVLPPVRFFWEVMRWMQTGSIAIAVNLFGESSLVHVKRPETLPIPPAIPVAEILAHLDERLAELETQPFIPVSRSMQYLRQRLQQLRHSAIALKPAEADPFQIRSLIRAGIDYFFSPQSSNPSLQQPSLTPKTPLKPIREIPQATESDPWLSWEDLFTELGETDMASGVASAEGTMALPLPTPVYRPPQAKPKLSPLVTPKPVSAKQGKTRSPFVSPTPASSPTVTPSAAPNTFLETDADWLETEAKPVGYVKHPLERILEWLDRLLLWFEEASVSFWNWLRKRL